MVNGDTTCDIMSIPPPHHNYYPCIPRPPPVFMYRRRLSIVEQGPLRYHFHVTEALHQTRSICQHRSSFSPRLLYNNGIQKWKVNTACDYSRRRTKAYSYIRRVYTLVKNELTAPEDTLRSLHGEDSTSILRSGAAICRHVQLSASKTLPPNLVTHPKSCEWFEKSTTKRGILYDTATPNAQNTRRLEAIPTCRERTTYSLMSDKDHRSGT